MKLICPDCKKELKDNSDNSKLECLGCHLKFERVRGVYKFVDNAKYADSFSTEWKYFRKTQLDCYTGTNISSEIFYRNSGFQPCDIKGKRVLDVGCGTGRYLEVALKADPEMLIGIDLSEAVYVAAENLLVNDERLLLLQCDANAVPLPDQAFDLVYSFGVIHHTPDPYKTWKNLIRLVKPGGRLSIWVYGKGRGNRLPSWIPRPIYLYRLLARRMLPSDIVLRIVLSYVPWAIKLNRLPLIGLFTRQLFPVIDYKGRFPLSDKLITEWACLDTYDNLTPKHAHTFRTSEVIRWYEKNSFDDIRVGKDPVSVSGRRI